jgi:1-deoxy-D-xylulose-5-phosphate synthase
MPKIIDQIDSPQDLKKLPAEKLPALADEIRALILDVVSRNGGHLASNLGVVELTLVLHYVFDSPRDKIIWDVGHQCYTHKILTGRKGRFSTLRQKGGLLGFPDSTESEHDIYNTGHASTALSAALGIAVARDKLGESHQVVAVVGDGGLTGGVAWEALNQIGHLREKVIIVLNYNEMSISPNVGALSRYLTYLVSGQHYLRIKDRAKTLLKSIPRLGWPMIKVGRALEDTVKKIFFPGLVFEELGIRYIGPVQGHSVPSLLEVFEEARNYGGPVLIHCVTQKGRGYAPAQSNPEKFHGAAPFNRATGEPLSNATKPTYSAVFGETLIQMAREDKRIIAITAAMPEGTGLSGFAREFPERFYDVGIAEQHAVNFAAGLAHRGLRPVVAVYSTFLQRAYDQLYEDVSLQDLPVVFALDRAGIVPDDGPTHQGINDLAYLRQMPNMIIMAPKDERELQRMLKSALTWRHPSAIRFPKGKGSGAPLEEIPETIELGRSELLKEGRDVLIALGSMVEPARQAAERLEKEGVSLAVVNARFVRPLDEEMVLRYAQNGSLIITAEEGVTAGGFGSAVREFLDRKRWFGIRFMSIGVPVEPYEMGKVDEIKKMLRLDADGLVDRIRQFYQGR